MFSLNSNYSHSAQYKKHFPLHCQIYNNELHFVELEDAL